LSSHICTLFIQNKDGINFAFVKKNGLYIVITSRFNASPSNLIETCIRITKIVKDFCGVINEEAVRKNFPMVYEILEELLDFGYP
jgi:AP-4 complex subunit mu-1